MPTKKIEPIEETPSEETLPKVEEENTPVEPQAPELPEEDLEDEDLEDDLDDEDDDEEEEPEEEEPEAPVAPVEPQAPEFNQEENLRSAREEGYQRGLEEHKTNS